MSDSADRPPGSQSESGFAIPFGNRRVPTRPRTIVGSARLVLLVGVLAGIGNLLVIPFANPDQFLLASDVYYHAANAWWTGGELYDAAPPERPGYTFLYPPIVVVLFLPHLLAGSEIAAYVLQTVLNLGFGVGLAIVIWRELARRGIEIKTLDRVLIVGFVLISAHSAISIVNGQVNIWLAFGLAVGYIAIDRRRGASAVTGSRNGSRSAGWTNRNYELLAGVAFGFVALIKVFPAVLGVWLLRCKAWTAVVAAIVTGTLGLVIGAILLGPDVTAVFLEEVLLGRYQEETFDGRPEPTQTVDGVQRQLAALTGIGSPALTLLSVIVIVPLVGSLYHRIDTDRRRLTAFLGTIAGMLLFFPLQPLYFPFLAFPLVVVLYTLDSGLPRTMLVVGLGFTFLRVPFDMAIDIVVGLPVPQEFESLLLAVLEPVFTFITPPTIGLWLILLSCLLVHRG